MTTPAPGEIRKLDSQTVERIAAGEVVERPASAVKELVENSLDADATRISVTVEDGGTAGITVSDDGHGMDEASLRRAVEKHTTSKIRDINDLETGVGTLGFRGEALYAIGAVSRLTITSRPRGAEQGTTLTVEGGEVTDVSPAGCPEGTTIEVRDLFYNVPARRKYLKQETTEFAHVNTVVTNYALASPEIAVSLTHNDRETFATNGTGNLQETILSVYGREVAESMISVDVSGEELPDGPLARLSGLVSHPETNRASRDYLSTFVNNRYVTAATVRDAVVDAYGGQLGSDRYPFTVLFLELDPATVDVNVHPRKLEVRFADSDGVHEQVETAVSDALIESGLLRTAAPRGRSAPEQTEIAPEQSVDETPVIEETPDAATDGEPSAASGGFPSERSIGPGEIRSQPNPDPSETVTKESPVQQSPPQHDDLVKTTRTGSEEHSSSLEAAEPSANVDASTEQPGDARSDSSANPTPDPERKFRQSGTQATLDGEDRESTAEFESLPSMRILGQFQDTYIVAETADGLVLIDQHAADERINYERLRESFAGETTTQALAEPVDLELTAREAELFTAQQEALSRLGFQAAQVDDRTVRVSTVPSLIANTAGPELVRDLLSELVTGETQAAETVEATVDALLGDLACYPSVTGNTSLTEGSVQELLRTLDSCTNPYACPHGRPVVIELATDEIEARFERDYPGHQ